MVLARQRSATGLWDRAPCWPSLAAPGGMHSSYMSSKRPGHVAARRPAHPRARPSPAGDRYTAKMLKAAFKAAHSSGEGGLTFPEFVRFVGRNGRINIDPFALAKVA